MRRESKPVEGIDTAFLQTTVQQATLLLRARGSAFYLCDLGRSQIDLAASCGMNEMPGKGGKEILEHVCKSRQPAIQALPEQTAILAMPSIWRDAVRGVLVVVDDAPERIFDEQDVVLLQPLADLTAAVLRQAERLTRMTAQFRALHVIDTALTSSLQLDRVLNLILDKAVNLVGAEHGSLRLLNPETGELVLRAYLGEGWTPEIRAFVFQIGHGITGWVAQNRRSYLCADAHRDPQNVVLFDEMRSGVAVPLLFGADDQGGQEELLGVMLLESTRQNAFDQHDVELAEALAQEAVIAIQNAAQHQRLQLMHQALEDEQERRVAAERWTVMGQAATALAHRINNLLGIVPVSASEIRRTLGGVEISQADRNWIEANLNRIERNGRFVLRMADALFRPFQESGPLVLFDVNRQLNEALQAANLSGDILVLRDYGQDLPQVESNSLLVDIFLELITNACKAMADRPKKRLEMRTRLDSDDAGRWVVVEISDTGGGIAAEQMAHLWDMFQPDADGLGFGLWWVRTFIERQGGTITCDSQVGTGSIFTVRLPAYSGVDLFEA